MEKEKKKKEKTHMVINDNCFKDILSNIFYSKTENTDIILYIQNKNHRLLL